MIKFLTAIFLLFSNGLVSAESESTLQEQLDAACEAAREEKLAPERQVYIEECIADWDRTREDCTHFYRDYGDAIY